MSENISRRSFVRRSAGGVGSIFLAAGGSWAVAASEGDAREWAFPLLGDIHIDHPDHHDMGWLAKAHPDGVAAVKNYSRITREVTPKLLAAVRQQAADSKANVPFTVQLGDLMQGLCGSELLATKQATDALDLVKKAELPGPFLLTKGNHDITGPGAAQVYDKLLVPFMAERAGKEVRGAAFTQEKSGVLVVFFDVYNRGSLDWFAGIMEKHKPRRLLFVIHMPVVPYNARSTWYAYSSPEQKRERERLLELLGRAGAVVLSGHLHKYSFLVRRTEQGRFVQLALSSVGNTAEAMPRDLVEDVKGYGPDLVKLEPRHSPETEERRRKILEAERPFIERFEYADTWGHAFVRVTGAQIRASMFRGLEKKAWKELDLTGALAGKD